MVHLAHLDSNLDTAQWSGSPAFFVVAVAPFDGASFGQNAPIECASIKREDVQTSSRRPNPYELPHRYACRALWTGHAHHHNGSCRVRECMYKTFPLTMYPTWLSQFLCVASALVCSGAHLRASLQAATTCCRFQPECASLGDVQAAVFLPAYDTICSRRQTPANGFIAANLACTTLSVSPLRAPSRDGAIKRRPSRLRWGRRRGRASRLCARG